jgi:hypothetical protein
LAGNWIKVEEATVSKSEVLMLADMLGWDRRQALGLLVEFWCWLDKNLSEICPDFVRNMSKQSLDKLMNVPGFSSCLEVIGWAKFDDAASIMTIPNAERHNGNPAKTRAIDQKRKKKEREKPVQDLSEENRTRLDKKRIDIHSATPISKKAKGTSLPAGFVLSDRVRAWGAERGYQEPALVAHFENFILQAAAKGYVYSDWDSALIKAISGDWAKVGKGRAVERKLAQ